MLQEHVAHLTHNRSPDQVWIFYTLESPSSIKIGDIAPDLINWTATYRLDSDLVCPYAKFVQYAEDLKVSWPFYSAKSHFGVFSPRILILSVNAPERPAIQPHTVPNFCTPLFKPNSSNRLEQTKFDLNDFGVQTLKRPNRRAHKVNGGFLSKDSQVTIETR